MFHSLSRSGNRYGTVHSTYGREAVAGRIEPLRQRCSQSDIGWRDIRHDDNASRSRREAFRGSLSRGLR